jgi:hypothetical protein
MEMEKKKFEGGKEEDSIVQGMMEIREKRQEWKASTQERELLTGSP